MGDGVSETGKTSDSALEYITRTWRELLTEPVTAGRPTYAVIAPETYDGFVSDEVMSVLRDVDSRIKVMWLTLPPEPLRELAENWDFQLTTQGRVNGPTRVTLHDALGNLTAHIELPPNVFIAKLPLPADSVIITKHEAVVRAGRREETT